MENYNYIESLIIDYFQKNISEKELQVLLQWMNENEENEKLFFELKEIFDINRGLYPTDHEISQSWERLSQKLIKQHQQTPQEVKPKRRFVEFFKYAAVAVIFTCLTLGITMLTRQADNVTYNKLNVEAGPRMSHIELPDGTKVVLNASTKFKFPNKFSKTREVYLDGEAYFEVTHDEDMPFIVNTDRQRIQVLGTSFNVMDYSTDDYAITTLVEGSVKMNFRNSNGNCIKKYAILEPNQQLFFNKTTNEISLTDVKIDPSRTWVNKIYHFKDEPFVKITQRLEKIYGIKIIIENEELKNIEYTGTFALDKDLNDVLNIINYENQFSYTIDTIKQTVSIK